MTRLVNTTLVLGTLAALNAAMPSCAPSEHTPEPEPACRAELRSWVVAGRGRHLFLQIECDQPAAALSGRVEFTEARLRRGYVAPEDRSLRNRVVKLNREARLSPPAFGTEDNRLEAVYELSAEQARCLHQDRLFSSRYQLLGVNSTSAMRRTMEACGLDLPPHVLSSGGPFGEFPGVGRAIGAEVGAASWARFGFADGPESAPGLGRTR